jgi:hypothetical protein
MSSMRFNARLDTSHHGPPHPYKEAGAIAAGATVKSLSVVNRSCILKSVQVSPEVKIQRIQIWRGAWRPCSGSSSTCPSGMTAVTENISHSTEHHHACAAFVLLTASGTSSSGFARSCKRESLQWLPVSRYGKTCGPSEQSPTISAHTLLQN